MNHDVGFGRAQSFAGDAIQQTVFADGWEIVGIHPFVLDAQDVDDIRPLDPLHQVVADAHAELLELARDERGRTTSVTFAPSLVRAWMLLRADAAVQNVADDRYLQPLEPSLTSNMVKASSRPCVGCSCVPSPALMMLERTRRLFR